MPHGLDDGLARDARHGQLAGGEDVHDAQDVGGVEGAPELARERLGAAVAVRLEDADDALEVELGGGGERDGDLGGVVAVVVDDGHARDVAHVREAPARALELGERGGRLALVEAYAKAQGLWYDAASEPRAYAEVIEFDLGKVERSIAGPSRPHDRIPLSQAQKRFCAVCRERGLDGSARETVTLPDGSEVRFTRYTSNAMGQNIYLI